MKPSTGAIDEFISFPFLSSNISALKEEFPLYIAAAEDVNISYDRCSSGNSTRMIYLHAWSQAARQILLVQPSSAASERVFSLLRNSFGERQHSSLQDYIEASLMLQYNKR